MDSFRQLLSSGIVTFTILFLCASCVSNEISSTTEPNQVMSMQLLDTEETLYEVAPSVKDELPAAVSAGVDAARKSGGGPSDRQSALRALEAIHGAFRSRGYAQPKKESDEPNRLGQALTPVAGNAEFKHSAYKQSDGTVVPGRYYVDCDIGAQLFISVAEEMGWEMRIVNVPKHTFLRWKIDDGEVMNWDWTYQANLDDSFYVKQYSVPLASVEAGAYMRSLPRLEAAAYYKGLLGSYAEDKSRAQLLINEAAAILPFDPVTQNNYVWHYVSGVRDNPPSPDNLVRIAKESLMWRPRDCNIIETLACAYGNAGEGPLGVKLIRERGCEIKYASTVQKLQTSGHCR